MKINWDDYPNLFEHEFACKCGCGRVDMKPSFLAKLQILRTKVGFPFPINSGFRCPEYEKAIGGRGEHTHGEAVDLGLFGSQAVTVMSNAQSVGFDRIGMKQHGKLDKRFVHLGAIIHPDYPSPWIWTYK
jgi:hypothetical protein